MSRSEPGAPTAATTRIPRFTRAERVTHWVNAGLFLVLLVTGAMFRFGFLQSVFSDRALVRAVHVYTGFAVLVAFAIGMAGRAGAALRNDVRRLGRWIPDDKRWLRSFGGDRTARLGKFNPGQKLNATYLAASSVVLAASGAIMYWNQPFSTDTRTGATFVHGWFALGAALCIFGHVLLALRDRDALQAMTGGTVSAQWALTHRPAWADEILDGPPPRNAAEVAETPR
jgi:formate dehydrogenase subunit gamma